MQPFHIMSKGAGIIITADNTASLTAQPITEPTVPLYMALTLDTFAPCALFSLKPRHFCRVFWIYVHFPIRVREAPRNRAWLTISYSSLVDFNDGD